jgi:hypothetical protein
MSKFSGRYSPGLYAGCTGILLLVGINAFFLPASLDQEKEKARLTAEAELEETKAKTIKKIAEAYSQNGVADVSSILLVRYTLSNTPPQIDWQNSVDPTKKTFVYDKNRQCVGYALKGKLYFTKYYAGVCNGLG